MPANLCKTVSGDTFRGLHDQEKIFCSKAQKDFLKTADYWIADKTFDVVSKTHFYQLFTVTAVSKTGITVPGLFVLPIRKQPAINKFSSA